MLLNKDASGTSLHLLLVLKQKLGPRAAGRNQLPDPPRVPTTPPCPQRPNIHTTLGPRTPLYCVRKGWLQQSLDVEGNTVPKSRGTRKFIASEKSWGRKAEPAEDTAGFGTRVLSSHLLLTPAQCSRPGFGGRDNHPSPQDPPSYHSSTKVQMGSFREGGWAPSPVAFAHPEVPGACPSVGCAPWGGAWSCRSGRGRGCSGRAPQFTTAELAMMFTPQAPDPRYK